jgi:hypothetical protein
MAMRGQGVILALISTADQPDEHIGGFGVACCAIESLYRQLAIETGKYGIRTVCLRSNAGIHAAHVQEDHRKQTLITGFPTSHNGIKVGEMKQENQLPYQVRIADTAVVIAAERVDLITSFIFDVSSGDLADDHQQKE